MKFFIFRNNTIEPFFDSAEAAFSGYDDILNWDKEAGYYVWFYTMPVNSNQELLANEIDSWLNKLKLVHSQLPAGKTLLVITLHDLFPLQFQNSNRSVANAIEAFNSNIYQLAEENKNIKVIDFASFTKNYPLEQLIDWKYYFISGMYLNPKLAAPFKKWFTQQVNAIESKRKKCLVLDLDNTLWGGILGEDGIDGIKIGGDYPGSAFLLFQNLLVELSKNGVILAICSKNNEQDVLDAWEKNVYITLKKEYITAHRINWNDKASNLQELAEELNIGLDSFVFLDDNPSERGLVKQLLPMVETPEFPEQPYNLPLFFKSVVQEYFQVYALTKEDRNKLHQYKANAERSKHQQNFNDIHEYLRSLEMQLTIQKATSLTVPRIAQMTQKTNQFNLTTKRYTESDINTFIQNGDHVYSLSVKDKFGDHGITGVLIASKDQNNATFTIDSLLLSCRILGKGIENAFINFILNKLKSNGAGKLKASYIPTDKNKQTADFYEKIGFEVVSPGKSGDKIKEYQLITESRSFSIDNIYKIEES